MGKIHHGRLFTYNALATNTYVVPIEAFLEIRNYFFDQDFWKNLFNIYGNLSQFVASCMFFPFKIPDELYDKSNPYYAAIAADVTIPQTFTGLDGTGLKTPIYPIYIGEFYIAQFVLYNIPSEEVHFKDYPPFTEYELFIPFFGYISIDNYILKRIQREDGEQVNNALYVRYSCDLSSGILGVSVFYTDVENENEIMIYKDTTQVGVNIPVAGVDTTILRNLVVSMTSNLVKGAVSSYAASVGTSSTQASSTITNTTPTTITKSSIVRERNPSTNRLITSRTSDTNINIPSKTIESNRVSNREAHSNAPLTPFINNAISGIENALCMRVPSTINGNISNGASYMSHRTPYIRVKTYDTYIPDEFAKYIGGISNQTYLLSDVKGYCEVGSIHLEIPCTLTELEEIESLLRVGVIITSNPAPEVSEDTSSGESSIPVEPIEPIEPDTKWLSPWGGSFRVTSTYGEKRTYTTADGKVYTDVHQGLDMVGIGDINIYSIAEGTVEYIGWQNASNPSAGFGYYCRVNTNGKLFYYAHMQADSSTLKVGDTISKGTKIGVMGSTGQVTGAHLHLEVRGSTASSSHENICSYTLLPNEIGTYE